MRRVLVGLTLSAALAAPAFAALKQGDAAPDFQAPAALAGKEFTFSLKEALKKGPVVVYFYPSAFTKGCNVQARTFAVNQEKFSAAKASIIGVSLDNIDTLKEFSADPEYCGGKVPVASDRDGKIAKSFDIKVMDARPGFRNTRGQEIDHGFAERTTFIVTPDGKIAATVGGPGVSPTDNVQQALEVVQRIAGAKPAA